jgi:hypothetical protein
MDRGRGGPGSSSCGAFWAELYGRPKRRGNPRGRPFHVKRPSLARARQAGRANQHPPKPVLAWSPLDGTMHAGASVAQTDFLIIGGGLAGVSAAVTLRALLPRAGITLVSGEIEPPHDRPPLSKELLRGEKHRDDVLLHPIEFYQTSRIDLMLGTPALSLDAEARSALLADGETIRCQRLLLATGGRARKLGVPGEGLPGIFAPSARPSASATRRTGRRASW